MTGTGRPAHSAAGGKKGFTLLEILVALALLGIAITMLLQLFAAGTRALSASEDYVNASLAAEARLREIVETEGLAEAAWQETDADGRRVDVIVAEALKDRTDGLPLRVFEVSVTTHWSWGMKSRRLTLHTLKTVDRVGRSAQAASPGA